jgi:hypothetical protein
MLKVITLVAMATVALAVTAPANPAFARDGAIAAGVIGGLAVGAIVGSQQRDYYGGPGYGQPYYQPVYGACHTEREQFVDQYGNYRSRRVRVCD